MKGLITIDCIDTPVAEAGKGTESAQPCKARRKLDLEDKVCVAIISKLMDCCYYLTSDFLGTCMVGMGIRYELVQIDKNMNFPFLVQKSSTITTLSSDKISEPGSP